MLLTCMTDELNNCFKTRRVVSGELCFDDGRLSRPYTLFMVEALFRPKCIFAGLGVWRDKDS
jgi:hypothetical protein